MKKTTARDLTQGSPVRLILGFMISVYLGMLFQEFYNFADMAVVGNYLGTDAFTGVGSTSSIHFFIIGFCSGMCTGFAIPVAREFGAKNFEKMQKYVANIIWVSLFFAVLLTAVTVPLTRKFLIITNTPEAVFDYAYRYIVVVLAGIPTFFLFNVGAGLIRAVGDSRTPVIFLIVASLANIVVNIISIVVLGFGVAGVAVSTILSNLVTGTLCLRFIKRRLKILIPTRKMLKPDFAYIKTLVLFGVPMGLQTSLTAVGTLIVQTSINGFGSLSHMAAMTASGRILQLFQSFFNALGSTMATFVSQNFGARRYERIRQGIRSSLLIGLVFSVFATTVIALFGKKLLLLFLKKGEEASIGYGMEYMLISCAFFIPLFALIIYRYSIQGIGYSGIAMFAGIVETLVRAFMAFIMLPMIGFTAIFFASPVAWAGGMLFVVPVFYLYYRKIRRDAGIPPVTKPPKPKKTLEKVEV